MQRSITMDKKLQRLETFRAEGNDGAVYVVHGFEHLVRFEGAPDVDQSWEPTGMAEYKLASGEPLQVTDDGSMHVVGTDLVLTRMKSESAQAA
jgi:hypothetical protein